jgi:hypothetical protein
MSEVEKARPARMWEVPAAPGRLAELVELVLKWAPVDAHIYRSPVGEEERIVVVDFGRQALPELPAELVARRAHIWEFERIW